MPELSFAPLSLPAAHARIDEAAGAGRTVLICAPAGTGKTVLAADWVTRLTNPAFRLPGGLAHLHRPPR
ncbi:hypothetical protein [Nocardia africana]|uniref:hypothetical protein n=1 Tax=Nocardia africana TaxID=134964 RepID=UPI001D15DDB0|nr:hypothetical protein [Nocardia africana]MCC3316664.1 hypothetical protein [Nocardia africana]